MATEARTQLIFEQYLSTLGKIGTPAPILLNRGSRAQKSVSSITVVGVLLAGGSMLVPIASDAAPTSVLWGASPLTAIPGTTAPVGAGTMTVYAADGLTPGTHDLVVSFAAPSTGAVQVLEPTHCDPVPLDVATSASGSGTTPSTGDTDERTHLYELLIGVIATNGPNEDIDGNWGNSLVQLAAVGTTGAPATSNFSLAIGSHLVKQAGVDAAQKTGITDRDWGAVMLTLKGNWLTCPGRIREDAPADAFNDPEQPVHDHEIWLAQVVTERMDEREGVMELGATLQMQLHLVASNVLGHALRDIRRMEADAIRALMADMNLLELLAPQGTRIAAFTPSFDVQPVGYRRGLMATNSDFEHFVESP